ncbi:DegV family protein [Lancefieldella rimae]|uniref:DegV family protein n=1 Tax=Lancefieldella rimae TaxID=1383 RepID=UPI0028ECD3E4|nr:DegV family protein [Lancefieldella rimae]
MADYALCCCSTADVSEELLQSRDIKYVYFNYELNGEQCKDDFGRTNAPADLYRKMLEGQSCRTSQISVGQYMSFWKPFLEAGQDVFHLTLSSGISGSYESAVSAREELKKEFPNRTIVVVDSLQASAGYGLLVDKVADKRDEGLTLKELEAWTLENRKRVYAWFFSTDLTFFIRGGRISKAAGLLGGMLNICPVMDVEPDGSLAVKEKARGRKKAERRIIEIMQDTCENGLDYADKVFISNSECFADAKSVADKIHSHFPQVKSIDIFDIGATIGVHTGPGTVATFWWGTKERG